MTSRLRCLWTLLWGAYLLLILSLTLGPSSGQVGIQHGDKIAHFGAFFLLIATAPWSMSSKGILAAMLLALALGAFIEAMQHHVSHWNRHAELFDFVADILGAGSGLTGRLMTQRSFGI